MKKPSGFVRGAFFLLWRSLELQQVLAHCDGDGLRAVSGTDLLADGPDMRAGSLKATYRTDKGTIVSDWRYEGDKCIWEYEIPEGASAIVTVPGRSPVVCKSGRYTETFMYTGGKR